MSLKSTVSCNAVGMAAYYFEVKRGGGGGSISGKTSPATYRTPGIQSFGEPNPIHFTQIGMIQQFEILSSGFCPANGVEAAHERYKREI